MKRYLGDSVYARFDGEYVWLYTDNGYGPNTPPDGIAIEQSTLTALIAFLRRAEDADHDDCCCGDQDCAECRGRSPSTGKEER